MISVPILAREGFLITFNTSQAIGKYRTNRKAVFKAIAQNNLYILREAQEALATAEGNITETDAELWHHRTGHTNYTDLFKLQHSLLGMKLKRRVVPVRKKACEACLAGKIREILSKKTSKREKTPGRGLHFDTIGRIGVSIRGYNYYLLCVDNATRYI